MNRWLSEPVQPICQASVEAAKARQAQLTKPAGSLGQLESWAITLAGLQQRCCPELDQVDIRIFAADHGVAATGVSAFPQSVTGQMVANFAHGGAAISVAARQLNASLEVVNLGTVEPLVALPGVIERTIAAGTACFSEQAAMAEHQLSRALRVGADTVDNLSDCQLFIGGEMGIGNTTTATALACALLDFPVADLVGPGTGVDAEGMQRKTRIIEQALALHREHLNTPLAILRCVGGFEIAALAGAYVRAAQQGIPVLVDGFICSVAALFAQALNPQCRQWMLFAHQSQEQGHQHVLHALDAQPMLDLSMRLGEGSGAAVAVPLLRMACAMHGEMASFTEAGVDNREH